MWLHKLMQQHAVMAMGATHLIGGACVASNYGEY